MQEQILALLDPDESPDPKKLRDSITQLLQGTSRTKIQEPPVAAHFFQGENKAPMRPPRRLKGLDASTIKVVDLSDLDDSADTDATVVPSAQKKREPVIENINMKLMRSSESPFSNKGRRSPGPSEIPILKERRSSDGIVEAPFKDRKLSKLIDRRRHSDSPGIVYKRSNSIESLEPTNTRRIAAIFEGDKCRHTPSPESRTTRSGSANNPEMTLRLQRMTEIIEGKKRDTPSPDRSKRHVGTGADIAQRRQKVADLIKGQHQPKQPEPVMQRRNSGDMAFRMQRMTDMMQKKNVESKRPKNAGKRKTAREIMRQRFEKSLQMLAAEPRLDFAPSADLENDYGLQQYRASAPQFDERVKKLERKLQHYVSNGCRRVLHANAFAWLIFGNKLLFSFKTI